MNKKKVLLTGSNGLLGQKIVHLLRVRNDIDLLASSSGDNRISETQGYTYTTLDLTDVNAITRCLINYRPDVIINTAALTNVDACETEKEKCWAINVDAVAVFLNTLEGLQNENYQPHFIHLSTDFVFDGSAGPYKETDQPNPLSYYAKSKFASEELIAKSKVFCSIARTIIVYGTAEKMSRTNIVLWAISALKKGEEIKIVDDQFRMPTLAEDLAVGCIAIMDKHEKGIFHLSGKDFMSILELVYRVADYFHLPKSNIIPIKSETLSQAAERPPKTGFILDKATKILNYQPHSFEEGLAILENQLKSE